MSDNTQEQFILARNEAMSDSPSHEEIQARKQEWEEKLKGKKFADEGALSTQEVSFEILYRSIILMIFRREAASQRGTSQRGIGW